MAGNANSGWREKPFDKALRMEVAYIENGEESPAPVGSLRWNARQLLMKGDVPAIKELADRLDGKVPQGHGGDGDLPPINAVVEFRRTIVRPGS